MTALVKALAGFHDRASARSFADLRKQYPDGWRTLHLTALVDTLAQGGNPSLDLWDPSTVAFLKKRAAEIAKLLQQ
jgi:hypothetical protein